jgi:hypothetical protein
MSKNVYDDPSSSALTPTITTDGITLVGGEKGQILIIGDTNGDVDGLDLGATNNVLVAGSNGLPQYTSDLSVNMVTTGGLAINGTAVGDLIQAYGSPVQFSRVPIGMPNQILTVGGVNNAVWQNLETLLNLYSPLQLPATQFTGNLTTGYPVQLGLSQHCTLITDSSGNVLTEPPIAALRTTPFTLTTTSQQIFISSSFVMTNNGYYKFIFNSVINCGSNSTAAITVNLNSNPIIQINSSSSSSSNLTQIWYVLYTGTTGGQTVTVNGLVQGSGSPSATLSSWQLWMERVPLPYLF